MSQMTPYCFKCGAELDPEAIYCASCGRLQRSMVVRSSEPTPGATPPPPPPPPGPQHDPRYSFYPDRQEPGTPPPAAPVPPPYAAQPQQPIQQPTDPIQSDPYRQNDWYGGEQGQPLPASPEPEGGDHVYAQQGYDEQAFGQQDQSHGQPYGPPDQTYGQAPGHGEYGQTYSPSEASPPQETYAQESYGQEPYGQEPYGQEQHGSAAYGQEQHGSAAYGQDGYVQPGYGQPSYGQPDNSQAGYGQPSYGQPDNSQAGYGRQDYGQPSAGDPYAEQQGYSYGSDPYPARAGAPSDYSGPYTPSVYSPAYAPTRRRSGGVPRPLLIIAVFGGLFLVGILIGKLLIGGGGSANPSQQTAGSAQQVVVPTQSAAPTAPPSVAPPLASPTAPAVTGNATWRFVSIPNFTCNAEGCPIVGNYKNVGQTGTGTVTFNLMDQSKTTNLASCTAQIPQADNGQTVQATCTANSEQLQQYFKTNGSVTVTAKVG